MALAELYTTLEPTSYVDIKQYRFSYALNLWNDTFEIKGFSQYDFEYLLDVDRSGRRAED